MKALLTTAALIALVSTAPALAQSDPAVTGPSQSEQLPGADIAPVIPGAIEEAPVPDGMGAAAQLPGDSTFLAEQNADEALVSEWIGQSVYNASDENIGDINDLVTAKDGSIRAVVLGVGGFLGLGEKHVAVPFEAIEPRPDADGSVTFHSALTMEQLEAAPAFKTLAESRIEEQIAEPPVPDAAAPPAVIVQ